MQRTSARTLLLVLILWLVGCASCAGPGARDGPSWQTLFDGRTFDGWESIHYGGEGEIVVGNGSALLPRGAVLTGIRRPAGLPRTMDYELEVRATRLSGNDFFCGLTFPVGDEFATVILGGWGGGLCGLSCIDGQDASQNVTKSLRSFRDDVEYALIVRVERGRIRAWLNRQLLFDVDTIGKRLSLRAEMLPSAPLSVSAFITTASIGPLRWRPLQGD
jgi:hypothetical protein